MLQTPIGKLKILLNDDEVDYKENFLQTETKSFTVDKRVQIKFDRDIQLNNRSVIKFVFINDEDLTIKSCIETGENLQLISFYFKNFKLSIGMEELQSVKYTYLVNGIQLEIDIPIVISEINTIVAWVEMQDNDLEDSFTWYAADPTLI